MPLTQWAIVEIATDEIVAFPLTSGDHPRDTAGYAEWSEEDFSFHQLDREGDPASEVVDRDMWSWVEDAALIDARLHARIDAEVGEFRCKFITNIPGQEMTYLRKESEARDFIAEGAGPWPVLSAQHDATGEPIADIAAAVVAQADAWLVLGAKIEAARMAAKQAVAAAETREAKEAAAVVDWKALVPEGDDPEMSGEIEELEP